MYSIQEQFKTDALAQISGRVRDAQQFAGNIMNLSREISTLNVRTTKASAEHIAGAIQKLFTASNPAEFVQLAATAMQPNMQLWNGYVAELQSIAGKASLPAGTSLTPLTSLLAPIAAPLTTWPRTESIAPASAVASAPSDDMPALLEDTQLEAAVAAVPTSPPPAAVPYAVGLEEEIPETPPATANTLPDTLEAIKEVAEAMTGVNKTPPVMMAASTMPSEEPAVPEIKVEPRNAAARSDRKPVAPAGKKAAPPARSASNRPRKK